MSDFSLEQFRAEMYMRAMREFEPILRDAIENVDAARRMADSAIFDISMVKRQLDALGRIDPLEHSAPAEALRDAMNIEVIARLAEDAAYVYFIEAGNFIKIGYSRDPLIRLGQIRRGRATATPDGLDTSTARLLAIEQGDMFLEKSLHKRFAEHRVAGEWFEKNDRLAHYIKSIATPA